MFRHFPSIMLFPAATKTTNGRKISPKAMEEIQVRSVNRVQAG
jgi:hypothetical protein